jgi:hypothetical protein
MPLFPPPQTADGKRYQNKGLQRTTYLTINGRISVRRRWWYDPDVGSVTPIDDRLTPAGENVTVGVRELACRLNNDACSFRRAAENLGRAAQIKMSAEQLRQLVERDGQRVLHAQQRELIAPAMTAAKCKVPGERKKTRMYVGVDGVMVPMVTDQEKQKRRKKVVQKRRQAERKGRHLRPLLPRTIGSDQPYKEFKAVVFYDETNSHLHVVLSRSKRTRISSLLKREAARVGYGTADERIANVDGASWIANQLHDAALRLTGLGLDFYHLSQNVHRARRETYGDESVDGRKWADDMMHMFKHEGYERAYEALSAWRAKWRGRKRAAATRLLNYVVDRRDMINFPEFVERSWQIGSGPTDASCKTRTARLKLSGQPWNPRPAEQVAAMANLYDNSQCDAVWASHLRTRG